MLRIDLPEVCCSLPMVLKDEPVVLAVLGGREPQEAWLKELPKNWYTVCADKGGKYAQKGERRVDVLVGDADSGGRTLFQEVEALGGKVILYPRDKDYTDTQLLLRELAKNPCHLVVAGAFGGRLDHLQSNIRSLLAYKKSTGKQVLLADDQEFLLLLGVGESCSLKFLDAKLPIISFLPWEKDSRVSGTNLKWQVKHFLLSLDNPNAISNVLLADHCEVICHSGVVGVYLAVRD